MPTTTPQVLDTEPDAPRSLLEVPDNVLQNILQRLDLQQSLAPVCRRWLQVARPSFIEVSGLDDEKLILLSKFLDSHGTHVTAMSLEAEWGAGGQPEGEEPEGPEGLLQLETALPCANLRDLELYNFQLQRRSAEANAGVLSAATGLTRLVMENVELFSSSMTYTDSDAVQPGSEEEAAAAAAAEADAAASFATVIQQLTSLQELQLRAISTVVEQPTEYRYVYRVTFHPLDIPGEGLAALTQLTKLSLFAAAVNPRDTLQHISRLQHLQDLQLSFLPATGPEDEPPQLDDPAAADIFAGLGALQHLTSLSVFKVPGMLTREHLQGGQRQISALTGLQRLRLDEVVFEPALLASMTQLTCLELSDIFWMLEAEDLPPGPGAGQPPPVHGLGAYQLLLLLLPGLKQLRRLRLDINTWPEMAFQLPAYSALTANTNLEHLDLQHYQHSLPTSVWKHMFRNGLQLPGIAGLKIQGIAPETFEDRVLHCCPVVAAGMMEGRLCGSLLRRRGLDSDDLDDDIACLAALRLLEVNADDPPGVPVVLAALTHLEVVFSDAFHSWSVHGCSEAEFQEGNFGMGETVVQKGRGGGILWQ